MTDVFKVTKYKSKRTKASRKARTVPRQDSPNVNDPRNITSYHANQVSWSWIDLPGVLYQFKPRNKSGRTLEVPRMAYPIHGKLLRDLPVLPDNISSAVEEFRVEAWMRLDRRIHLKDITERMHPAFRVNENALQQRGVRFRQAFSLIAWESGNKRSRELEFELLGKMEEMGIDPLENSTRGITPGLINPARGEEGGRIPLPEYYSEEGRFARGRKPKKSQTQTHTRKQSFSKCEELKPSQQATQILECVNKFVPFEEYLEHQSGALPVIRGEVPDDKLPTVVDPRDLDLHLGFSTPEPQPMLENLLQPIGLPEVSPPKQPSIFKPSAAFSLFGFCSRECYRGSMMRAESMNKPEETLEALNPQLSPLEKPRLPGTEIYPVVKALEIGGFPVSGYGFSPSLYSVIERYPAQMALYYPFQ